MDIENLFRPNKWFVGFFALFVVIWLIGQFVGNVRVGDDAKFYGAHIFTWRWPSMKWRSRADMTDARVIKKTGTEAIVEVRGKQEISGDGSRGNDVESDDCSATLTFYKYSNRWELGRVDLR